MNKQELESKIKEIEKMIEGFGECWSLYDGNNFKSLKELTPKIKAILIK